MEIFSLFSTIFFTTSEMGLGYYHEKVNLQVASQVAKLLKAYDLRKLRNFKKIPEMLGFDGEFPFVHQKAKF